MRNDETYVYLWENAFERAIQDVQNSISLDAKKEYNFALVQDLEKIKEDVLHEYNVQRKKVRERYFDVGENESNLIDVHKICACFTAAMLKVRVFEYKGVVPIKAEIFYSNYTLAFLVGMHIMYLCMLSDYEKNKDKRLYNKLKEQATILFPDTNCGHDKYLQGRIKTLALNDVYGVDFDVLTYADMLFWIEKYNKDILEKE